MATLVTVSCDRCGSIIPKEDDRHTASVDVRTAGYDGILRESWELCCECFGLVHRTLLDRCGPASDSWKQPEPSLKAEALRAMERSRVTHRDIELGPVSDPIAVAQRVLDGGEGPE